jgi:hypothetical protein
MVRGEWVYREGSSEEDGTGEGGVRFKNESAGHIRGGS